MLRRIDACQKQLQITQFHIQISQKQKTSQEAFINPCKRDRAKRIRGKGIFKLLVQESKLPEADKKKLCIDLAQLKGSKKQKYQLIKDDFLRFGDVDSIQKLDDFYYRGDPGITMNRTGIIRPVIQQKLDPVAKDDKDLSDEEFDLDQIAALAQFALSG